MIFTLTDRHYNPLDSYETDDYLIGRYIGSILETLDLNISLTSLKAEHWVRGNYIMCRDSTGRGYWFTIYDDEDSLNGDDRALSCYSGTIDIVAEECPPFEETVPRSFGWYFSKVFIDTGIQLGINELSGMTRTLKFESKDATNAEMLQFVLNAFDNAEARLDVAFDGSRPTRLTLNVFKRLGETVPKVLLSDESDSLTDLDRTGSISDLGTSLLCYGAQDDNQKEISLVGKYYEEKDSNGNILYVSPKDSPRIFSVKAHEEYYVQLPGKKTGEFDGYINRSYQSEASTQDSLWNEGLAQLKKIDHAIVDYKATGYVEGCDIGDNVQIAAHRMRPAVMVSARLTTFKFNEDDPERNEYEFTNFVDLESNLDDMSDIINKIKDQIVYVIDQSVEYCLSDQGTTAPEIGWSNLNPGAVKGKWLWTRTKIDYSNGTSSVSEVPTYSGVNGEPGKDGEQGPQGEPGSKGEPGTPGADGRTPYLHTAYANSADGLIDFTPDSTSAVGYDVLDISKWSKNTPASNSTYKFTQTGGNVYKVTGKGTGGIEVFSNSFSVKKGDTLRFTIEFVNRLQFNLWNGVGLRFGVASVYSESYTLTSAIVLPNTITERTQYTFDYTATTDVVWMLLNFAGVADSSTVDLDLKINIQNLTTEKTYDYLGTMTDFIELDSLNPTDYSWVKVKGDTGPQGPKGDIGSSGSDGKDGVDALPVFSGYVTNEAIILSATNSGAVSDFSKATGTFVTYLGQDQLTSGVTYSRVSQSGVTATINQTTGAYSVTAASADTGMAVFKAVYQGIELQKIVSVTKAKQGNTGDTGAKGADGKDGANGAKGEPGDDGVSSYLHTAWKMADGAFTTEYPQENLIILSQLVNGAYDQTTGLPTSGPDLKRNTVPIILESGASYVVSNSKPTKSMRFFFYDADGGYVSNYNTSSAVHKIIIPSNATKMNYVLWSESSTDGSYVYWKLEKGDTPTIYTPAPSDDYTLAYPKYRGEYTDTIEADSTDPNRYTWTAYLGEQGPPTGVISQSTVPSSPYVGMLWQNTGDIAGYINPATYRWNGSSWEIYQFTAQNILAETFTGFVFQGVKFIGSEFISNYSITKDSKTVEGTLSIGNGNVLNDYSDSDGVVGKFTIDESGAIINQRTLPSGIGEKYELTPYSLALDGETYRGNVTARQLSQLNAVGDRLWDGAWHMSASQTITPDRPLSSCLTGWLLEFQGYSSNTAQDTDYSYIAVPKSHSVYHSGKPMSPAVTVYGGAITRKILYITDTTIKGHANNAASPASGAVLTAVYAN